MSGADHAMTGIGLRALRAGGVHKGLDLNCGLIYGRGYVYGYLAPGISGSGLDIGFYEWRRIA